MSLTQTGNAEWRTEKEEDSRIGTNPGDSGEGGDGGDDGEGGEDGVMVTVVRVVLVVRVVKVVRVVEGGAGSHCLGWLHSQDATLILHSSVLSYQ